MTAFAHAPQSLTPIVAPRLWPAIRYGGVLLVWLGLTVVRPRLGLEIYRNRRPNSPLRRSKRNETSKLVEKARFAGGSALDCP